jgi:cytosine/adenosine deaminase-related metal-dependent hydrolase
VTHRYTLAIHGTVLAGPDEPEVTAIAWAEGTVIALGDDADVRAISRGDSHVVDLGGACVVPLGTGPEAAWPAAARLEVGGPADLAILEIDPRDPRAAGPRSPSAIALVRAGRVVAGRLPGRPGEPHAAP